MNNTDNWPESYGCVKHAILYQISRAKTWRDITTAWDALLNVERIAGSIKKELDRPEGGNCTGHKSE